MPEEMKKAVCKSCGADIYWVTLVSGKKQPLNTDPKIVTMHYAKDRWKVATGYEPHHATCPQADLWREKVKKYEEDK